MTNLAIVRILRGDPDEGVRWLDRTLPKLRAAGHRVSLLYALAARWATLPTGREWDVAFAEVVELQRESGIEDADLARLAEIAAGHADPERAQQALTWAACRAIQGR